MKSKFIIILILLGVILQPLVAEIIASYEPETLAFTAAEPPFDYRPSSDPNYLKHTHFVALLGTLTITATAGETLYQPALVNLNMDEKFYFEGPFAWSNNWETGLPDYNVISSEFYLAIVTSENNQSTYTKVWGKDGIILLSNSKTLSGSFYEVKLYFLANQYAYRFKPGGRYTMISPPLGTFTLIMAPNNIGVESQPSFDNNITIPLSNYTSEQQQFFISDTTTSVPYEDPDPDPDPPDYQFTIIQDPQINLNLSQAYESSAKVADAQMTIIDGIQGETYEAYISFASNSVDSEGFNLRLTDNQNLYKIPYNLIFNNESVVPVVLGVTPTSNQIIPWEGIHYQNATVLPIYVTGIDQSTAEQAPAGTYSDTITVTIIPVDTL